MSILLWWLIAAVFFLLVYVFAVRGRIISWYALARALPGIIADVFCQAWLDITEWLPWRRKKEIRLDFYEKEISK